MGDKPHRMLKRGIFPSGAVEYHCPHCGFWTIENLWGGFITLAEAGDHKVDHLTGGRAILSDGAIIPVEDYRAFDFTPQNTWGDSDPGDVTSAGKPTDPGDDPWADFINRLNF